MSTRRGPTWEPRSGDFHQIFREQNPWHESGHVPAAWARRVQRPLARLLPERLLRNQPNRFQLILGPRRVGKTTSMYQAVQGLIERSVPADQLWWLRLDHPLLMDVSLGDLCRSVIGGGEFASQPTTYLFLDEITYAKDWDLWLKTFYDESWPIRVVGSSSSTAALRNRRLESGVGRWEEQYLSPYLFPEYLSLIEKAQPITICATLAETIEASIDGRLRPDLSASRRRFLLTGGFPELLIADKQAPMDEESTLLQSQRTLRSDAVERAIYKDIPQAFNVSDPMLLERLLYTLAGQVTGILSPSSICQGLGGLTTPTFDRYLSYLERSFLVFTLPNYSGSEASRQKRGRKLYFTDGAVRNAALQRGLAPLSDPAEMGLLIENMAAGHIKALGEEGQVRIYHWRDKEDEVDLVYDHPDRPLAFEIGSSTRHHRGGLRAFLTRFPRFEGRAYLVTPGARPCLPSRSPDGIGSLPLDLFLLAVGGQAESEMTARIGLRPLDAS